MIDVNGIVRSYISQAFARPADLKKNKGEYEQKINALVNQFNDIQSEQFKKMPKSIQSAVLKDISNKNINILPYLSKDTQSEAFENSPLQRSQIACCLSTWDASHTTLKISKNYLKSDQILRLLDEMTETDKAKIKELDLSECMNLEKFDINQEKFTQLKHLVLPKNTNFKECKLSHSLGMQLEQLTLSETGIVALDFLKECPNLKSLQAESCGKLKDIDSLQHCIHLEKLSLTFCSAISNIKFSVLGKLENLKDCDLHGTLSFTSSEPLKGLSSLQQLDIRNTGVSERESALDHVNVIYS
jgi:hypothetical protein